MAAIRPGRPREPTLLARYGAQFAKLLTEQSAEVALSSAQAEAQRNADSARTAISEAQSANEQLQNEKERLLLAQSRLDYIETHDKLTALPNRSHFNQQLEKAVQAASATGSSFALFHVDLDHFKDVNDTLGHGLGDELLKEVANRLLLCADKQNVVARLGGDEFAVLVADLPDSEAARVFAAKIVTFLTKPCVISGQTLFVGASIGVTIFPEDADNPTALNRNADIAMHRCKQEAGNGYQFYNLLFDEAIQRRTSLERAFAGSSPKWRDVTGLSTTN